jgi:DNA modification methylase
MEIAMRKVSELTPYEKNAKTHDAKQIANVANSIKRFGWQQPIVIDENGVVVIGHCRLMAAKKLKLKEVPVTVASGLTEDEIKELRIADNKTNESPWDLNLLAEDIEGLDFDGFDIDFGVAGEVGGITSDDVVEDDFDVTPPEQPKAKLGDIYQLGEHRLMCGDSTDKATVEMLMNGKKADMVFTDPPYGIDVVQGDKIGGDKPFGSDGGNNIVKTNKYMAIKGDETTDTAKLNFEIIKELSENQIIFGGNYFTDFLPPKACWCIWDKENTGNFADVEMAWTSFNKGAKLYRWLWNGLCRRGERAVEGKSRVHPTQKPVGLIAEILKDFTKENDIILDCFGGSGSTLIACEQIDRTCYMIEYEAHYVDVIIKRWETLTGKNAVLLNG